MILENHNVGAFLLPRMPCECSVRGVLKLRSLRKMDKKIKELQKDTKRLEKKEGSLLKEDKKRDKAVEAGEKSMKKK